MFGSGVQSREYRIGLVIVLGLLGLCLPCEAWAVPMIQRNSSSGITRNSSTIIQNIPSRGEEAVRCVELDCGWMRAAAIGARELAAVLGAHGGAQRLDLGGVDAEERLHAGAGGWRYLGIGFQARSITAWARRCNRFGIRVPAGVEVDAG